MSAFDEEQDRALGTRQTRRQASAAQKASAAGRRNTKLDCGSNHYTGCACHEAAHRGDLDATYERGYLAGLQSYLQGAGDHTRRDVEALLAREQRRVERLRLYVAGLANIKREDIIVVHGCLTAILEDRP